MASTCLLFLSVLLLDGEGIKGISSRRRTCPYKAVEAPPKSGISDRCILGVAVPVTSPCSLPTIVPLRTIKLPEFITTLASLPPFTSKFGTLRV
jgi:hypothetical protein